MSTGRPHTANEASTNGKPHTHTLRGSSSAADTSMLLNEPNGSAGGRLGTLVGGFGKGGRTNGGGFTALSKDLFNVNRGTGNATGTETVEVNGTGTTAGEKEGWEIKVKERKVKEKGRKVSLPVLSLSLGDAHA